VFVEARSTIRGRRKLPTARAMPRAQLDEENVASGASYFDYGTMQNNQTKVR
jgi:hypothetical protein